MKQFGRFIQIPSLVISSLVCIVCLSCAMSAEDSPCKDPCAVPTAWAVFNVFDMKVVVSGEPGSSLWKGRFDADSGDIQIEANISDAQKVRSGKILMVGGRVMAVQGPITEPGHEIDALDAPVLYYQLLLRMLGAILPDAPSTNRTLQKVDFKEEKTGIQFATPSAQGFIHPPWHVTGDIEFTDSDTVRYNLTLISARDGHSSRLSLTGKLSKTQNAKIDDAMLLDAWNLFGVGVQARGQDEGTMYDYGAGPTDATYKTIADIRKKIAQDDDPGEPDPSRDFTGFWKGRCEEAFGLSIAHFGTDGKYTVTFCGPGGCGDPAEERKTFINKDSEYEIISETELRIGNAQHRETYYKCTTDTHPMLRYKEQ